MNKRDKLASPAGRNRLPQREFFPLWLIFALLISAVAGFITSYIQLLGQGLAERLDEAICRKIVGRHGGQIRAESAGAGQGAIFSFTLSIISAHKVVQGGG